MASTIPLLQWKRKENLLWHKHFYAVTLLHREPFSSYWHPLPMWYNTGKQNADAHQATGLTSACIFRFLQKGAMPSAANHPLTHNCSLKISYRTGGNNQLGPQEEAHKQFRYSAARNRTHRPVHPPRHPSLLRKWRRSAGVPGVAGSAWNGTDGRKGREKQVSNHTGCSQLGGTLSF